MVIVDEISGNYLHPDYTIFISILNISSRGRTIMKETVPAVPDLTLPFHRGKADLLCWFRLKDERNLRFEWGDSFGMRLELTNLGSLVRIAD